MHIVHVEGPLVKRKVEAIVSPTHCGITHTGSIARDIFLACGGQNLKEELEEFSPIKHGSVVVTPCPSKLFKKVLHAAVVDFNKKNGPQTSVDIIKTCVSNALRKADENNLKSIAIPLLGATENVAPTPDLKDTIFKVVKQYADFENDNLERVEIVS